jgi:hypothetical protein
MIQIAEVGPSAQLRMRCGRVLGKYRLSPLANVNVSCSNSTANAPLNTIPHSCISAAFRRRTSAHMKRRSQYSTFVSLASIGKNLS